MRLSLSLLVCVSICSLQCLAGDQPNTFEEGPEYQKVREALNAYYIAEADHQADLIEHRALEARRKDFREASAKRPSSLCRYIRGGSLRAKIALGVLQQLEGVKYSKTTMEGVEYPDIDAWREHFKKKDALFRKTENKKDDSIASAEDTCDYFFVSFDRGGEIDSYGWK